MLAQTVILAAEEDAGPAALLLPATPELIAGVIAFAIVFFFIWRWVIPNLNKSLEERQQAIGGQIEAAEKAKAEADALVVQYQEQLANIKAKETELLDAARAEAETVKADLVTRAEAQAAEIIANARASADAERERLVAEVQQDVANLSIDLAEKVVGGALDRDAQMGLVERYIAELGR